MTYLLLTFIVTSFIAFQTAGLSLDLAQEDNSLPNDGGTSLDGDAAEGRFLLPLFLPSTGAGLNLNVTILASLIAALSSAFMSLLTMTGLGMLMASNMNTKKELHYHVSSGGYGTTSSYGSSSGSSYGSSYRRMLMDPLNLDWETVTLVDWMALVNEIWEDFDPSDLDCQKRFICDVHRNAEELGPVAQAITHYFGYLRYGEVFRLPGVMKEVLEEYLGAAEIGMAMKKDCNDVFTECDFSVKDVIKKYTPNHPSGNDDDSYPTNNQI